LSQDPIGLEGGINLYGYVGNNPINASDPLGLCPFNASQATGWLLAGLGSGILGALVFAGAMLLLPATAALVAAVILGALSLIALASQVSSIISQARNGCVNWNSIAFLAGQLIGSFGVGRALTGPRSGQALISRILSNPKFLTGKMPWQIAPFVRAPNWRTGTLGRGSHKGQGWTTRHWSPISNHTTGPQLRWHPGGGHHGQSPYWYVGNGRTAPTRVGPQF